MTTREEVLKRMDQSMKNLERYEAAAHAMQSGVAMEMNYLPGPTEPKHLRVGVNTAMVDHGALAKLLVDKGIITLEEYEQALADAMEQEQRKYEETLTKIIGTKVTLA